MTYIEYLKWLEKENIDLNKLEVKINNPTLPTFEIGCYNNNDGTWTYYKCEERSTIKEIGSEEEIFDKMKKGTISKVIEYEYKMSCEIRKNLLLSLQQKNIPKEKFNNISKIIELNVRYKMGKGFGLCKIIKGEEVFISDFYNDEESFLKNIL